MYEPFLDAIEQRSPRGVAGGVSRLIRDGSLPPGMRLPTVRGLAGLLGALTGIRATDDTRDYYDAPVIPALHEDAQDRIIRDSVGLGSPVLVENPGYPPLLDALELVGALTIPLELDAHGGHAGVAAGRPDQAPGR